ncbi:hypothetical protein GCM10007860_04200 [Chitiniphilus shinanonensis]|uniref:N-acetyltransferase domain-containing protein n=1 Tax=Chitiniphilus shinanonensis TaxID=553088 RepID=A0ABQ6BSU1_9NEIS|nr:GNAT family N-acetyltransferase [Chitiniphilus shinanonensis]GLS03277.1 hypothetical protein GCM10007860_04200 [Chitiniphilus shinanonensis]
MQLRLLQESDLDAVMAIQAQCYPEAWLESRAVFARKLTVSPESNWVAEDREGVVGYLFTHPWRGARLPELDTALQALPHDADQHFLHDLAVHPRGRGRGVAARLVLHALAWGVARGLREARLIAVLGADRFWHDFGFTPLAVAHDQLAGYGEQARAMGRVLAPT